MKFDRHALSAWIRFLAEEAAREWLEEQQEVAKDKDGTLLGATHNAPDTENATR